MDSELEEKGDQFAGGRHEQEGDKTCDIGPDDVGHSRLRHLEFLLPIKKVY